MSTSLDSRVAQELRAELARQMHSKRWMAATLGESPSTMNRWLNGQTVISLNDLDRMCRALDMTIADLLGRIDNGTSSPGGPTPDGGVTAGNRAASTAHRLRRAAGRLVPDLLPVAASTQVAA